MIARAQRAHFVALTLLRMVGNGVWQRAGGAALLLDALQILGAAVAARDGPLRAAEQHVAHARAVERDLAFRAHAGRNMFEKRIGERLLHGDDLVARQAGEMRADAAGDVEADAARRHDAALIRVESRNPANRKTIAPMRVRHGVGGAHDPR